MIIGYRKYPTTLLITQSQYPCQKCHRITNFCIRYVEIYAVRFAGIYTGMPEETYYELQCPCCNTNFRLNQEDAKLFVQEVNMAAEAQKQAGNNQKKGLRVWFIGSKLNLKLFIVSLLILLFSLMFDGIIIFFHYILQIFFI